MDKESSDFELQITLKLIKLEDLWHEGARDAKAMGAVALYEGLRKTGKL